MINKENEEWRDVIGYEGLYQVSNYGDVKSLERDVKGGWGHHQLRREKSLKPVKNSKGYLMVGLFKESMRKIYSVHRLVAQAFLSNPQHLPCINHKDENPLNNHVSNLEWCTSKYNTNYGTCIERRADKCSKRIIQLTLDGKIVKVWKSVSEVQRVLGWRQGHISMCALGTQHTAYNHKWQYVEDFLKSVQ